MAGLKNTTFPLLELTAISPLDGRYRKRTEELSGFVSEFALIKTRLELEVYYLFALSKKRIIRKLTKAEEKLLLSLIENFSLTDAQAVKKIEEEVRHDVKSVERFLRIILKASTLQNILESIHFGLTSEDINNIAYRLMLKRATLQVCVPHLESLVEELCRIAKSNSSTPMLARTHGQAAVPTTLGKELVVFAYRLQKELPKLKNSTLTGKLNGAVGNYNALSLAFPKSDWISFSKNFLKDLGLEPSAATTQINPYDDVVEYLQIFHRINSILIDFNQDIWRYISDNWFIQISKKDEVGSSTMPQKINPIDFENSEGNLQIANAFIEGLCRKLPISRLQRDLSDSTTIRNISVVLGHSLLGYQSTLSGLFRVKPHAFQMKKDLHHDWSILTEGVQTILRKHNVSDSYSLVKNLSRGRQIPESEWNEWIKTLPVEEHIKKDLQKLSPSSYVGLAEKIVLHSLKEIQKLKK